MKLYEKKEKENPAWGYWGDYGEIDMGISYGEVKQDTYFDKLHYNKKGRVYILPLEGKGGLEINGKQIEMPKDILIGIDPRRYKHTQIMEAPLRWITICSVKDIKDKVVLE